MPNLNRAMCLAIMLCIRTHGVPSPVAIHARLTLTTKFRILQGVSRRKRKHGHIICFHTQERECDNAQMVSAAEQSLDSKSQQCRRCKNEGRRRGAETASRHLRPQGSGGADEQPGELYPRHGAACVLWKRRALPANAAVYSASGDAVATLAKRRDQCCT